MWKEWKISNGTDKSIRIYAKPSMIWNTIKNSWIIEIPAESTVIVQATGEVDKVNKKIKNYCRANNIEYGIDGIMCIIKIESELEREE